MRLLRRLWHAAFPRPEREAVWLSLHHSNPWNDEDGSSEVDYPGYCRVAVPRNAMTWHVACLADGSSKITNLQDIHWPECTANTTVRATHVGVCADRLGPPLFASALDLPSAPIGLGMSPLMRAGNLTYQTESWSE